MSIIIQYLPFFNVSVEDEASGDPITGLSFTPSPECRDVLADHHLVFRARDSGFQVYYETNPAAADPVLGKISSRVRLSFLISAIPADMFDRFEPQLTPDTGPQLYLDNLTPAGNIQGKTTLSGSTFVQTQDATRVYPDVFSAIADLSTPPRATEFRVNEYFGGLASVVTVPIPSGGTVASAKIDLSEEDPGPYVLATDSAAIPDRNIYVDSQIAETTSSGVVDLYWDSSQSTAPAGGVSYTIRFRKR
ncbi:MAG: hypothetical protein ACC655_03630 [Rhodothermia bacterium]